MLISFFTRNQRHSERNTETGANHRNLSILMVCPQFYPIIGGYERAAERMAEALIGRGHQVTVITERRYKAWPATEVRRGVFIKRWWCLYKPHWHTLTSSLGFIRELFREGARYDVIHVHQYGNIAALSVVYGKARKIPVLLKLTSTKEMGLETTLRKGRFSGISSLLHRQVDVCVATTKNSFEEAERFGIDRKRLRIIGNSIDCDYFSPLDTEKKLEMKKKLGLNVGPTVLFVGRLSPEKNPLGLIDAWKIVIEKVPSAILAMVGDGPLLEALKATTESLNLGSSIIIVGHSHDVLQWYQAADIFVLPSITEGLSNSLLEALSCGLPVVSTRVSGSIEAVEKGLAGKLVDVDDMEGLALGILELLKNELYRKTCGENGRRFVVENYTQELIAEKMESIYYSVCRPTKVG